MDKEVELSGDGVEAVQPVVQRQHEAAGLAQRGAAAVLAGQGIDPVLPGQRVIGLQAGLLDIEPPDSPGRRAPQAAFAKRIVRLDHTRDVRHRAGPGCPGAQSNGDLNSRYVFSRVPNVWPAISARGRAY